MVGLPSPSIPGSQQHTPQMTVPSTPTPQAAGYSDSANYSCQLIHRARGFPVFVPGNFEIGDICRLTPDGQFEVFFNIYKTADIPGLIASPLYDSKDILRYNVEPGNYVSSVSVLENGGGFIGYPGGPYVFDCCGPNGAVLALPHGARVERLENRKSIQELVEKYADSWYRHVNGTRGRELVNGSLYLVTGWEKATSWGMASFRDVSPENHFEISFRPLPDSGNGYKYRWHAPYCPHRTFADSPAVDNSTVFIHAYAISLREGWEKVYGAATCQLVDSSTFPDTSGRSFIPHGSSSERSLFSRGSSSSRGNQGTGRALVLGNDMVSDTVPMKVFHPSAIIHERIFRELPQAKVVVTHDDDWRDVFRDGSEKNPLELQQAIFDRSEIVENDGVVTLVPKSLSYTTVSRNVQQRQDYRVTTDGSLENAGLPSEGTPYEMSEVEYRGRDFTADTDSQTNSSDTFCILLFNAAFPHTPSYNGSHRNSPNSHHLELFSSSERLRSFRASEPTGSTAVQDDYDPFTYRRPSSSLAMLNDHDDMLGPCDKSQDPWVAVSSPTDPRGASEGYSSASRNDVGEEGDLRGRASSISSYQFDPCPPVNVVQVFDTEPLPCGSPSLPHLQPQSPRPLPMSNDARCSNFASPPLDGDGPAFHHHIVPPPPVSGAGVASTALPSQTGLANLHFPGEHAPDYVPSICDLPRSAMNDNHTAQMCNIGPALEDKVTDEVVPSYAQSLLDTGDSSRITEAQLCAFPWPSPGSAELDNVLLSSETDLQRSQTDVEATDLMLDSRFLSPDKHPPSTREHHHSHSLWSDVTFADVPGLVGGSQTTTASSMRPSPYPSPNASLSSHCSGLHQCKQEGTFICPGLGCGGWFKRSFDLQRHETEDKPLSCNWPGCGRKFTRLYDAKRHEQLHKWPFTYEKCNEHFCSDG